MMKHISEVKAHAIQASGVKKPGEVKLYQASNAKKRERGGQILRQRCAFLLLTWFSRLIWLEIIVFISARA
jgi:hypothetical protein